MKILYYHQHFCIPEGAGGTRSYEFARRLVQNGHSVVMVCGSHATAKTGLDGPFIRGRREGLVEGIRVIEFNIPYSNKDNFLKRSLLFAGFALKSIKIALVEKYDIVFATSTPLTVAIPGIVAKIFRRKKFVLEIRDLWPELPKAMKVITNPFILFLLSVLERSGYWTADGIIGLSPGICKGIKEKTGERKSIAMIPNGCDIFDSAGGAEVKELPASFSKIRSDGFKVAFTGTHGIANGLDAVLDAASELKKRGRDDIQIIFVGDGKLKPELQERVKLEKLDNCLFLDVMPKKEIKFLYKKIDAGLQVLANIPAFYWGTSPNKFFDYISVGLPVLINYPGWLAEMIAENKCGFCAEADDPIAFADAIEKMADNPEQVKLMGQASLQLAKQSFNRDNQAAEMERFLLETYENG
jgi:glycosyltransferase involved in cell wall biosynthesis